MGTGNYDLQARVMRANSLGYATTHAGDSKVFVQAAERKINQGMDPAMITMRECRDNEDHPNTFPVILALDVTGSMGQIPVQLIRDDLPTLMEKLLAINPDISLCFMAVGDHECDRAPLQVGQFEANDEMLDHWLTRTWIEGGGGGNTGESYALPWMFAANKVVTDAWEKRGQKGMIITIGDEPILPSYHDRVKRIFGPEADAATAGFQTFSKEEIYELASERWDIHHIGMRGPHPSWNFLGENFHATPKSPRVSGIVAGIIQSHFSALGAEIEAQPATPGEVASTQEIPTAL